MLPRTPPVLPPSIQAKLDNGETHSRPLGDLNTAMRDLNLDPEEVRALVNLGYLVAFDISAGTTLRRRPQCELRILTRSIERFRALKNKRPASLEWPQIFRLIVPHQNPVLKGTELQRALNCHRGHVQNLIAAKLLEVVRVSSPGRGGTWGVGRRSFENFLKDRLC